MEAAATSDLTLMRILLDAGANPNAATDDHTTLLMMAAALSWHDISSLGSDKDSITMITLLMEHGADVNAFNDDGLNGERRQARPEVAALLRKLMTDGQAAVR